MCGREGGREGGSLETIGHRDVGPENPCPAVAAHDSPDILAVHALGTPGSLFRGVRRPNMSGNAQIPPFGLRTGMEERVTHEIPAPLCSGALTGRAPCRTH